MANGHSDSQQMHGAIVNAHDGTPPKVRDHVFPFFFP